MAWFLVLQFETFAPKPNVFKKHFIFDQDKLFARFYSLIVMSRKTCSIVCYTIHVALLLSEVIDITNHSSRILIGNTLRDVNRDVIWKGRENGTERGKVKDKETLINFRKNQPDTTTGNWKPKCISSEIL